MAKREPFTNDAFTILKPGELWFEFGATEDDAMERIRVYVAERAGPFGG